MVFNREGNVVLIFVIFIVITCQILEVRGDYQLSSAPRNKATFFDLVK